MKQRLKNFFAAIGFRHMSVGGACFFFANTAIMVLLIFQIGVFVPLIVLLLISGMIIWAHTQLDSLGVSDPERRVLLRQDAAWIGFSDGLGVIFIFSGAWLATLILLFFAVILFRGLLSSFGRARASIAEEE